MKNHYDEVYFSWQRAIGKFVAEVGGAKFARQIKPSDNVVDFGCGGGYLLAAIDCAGKLGVEINKNERAEASAQGIQTVESTDEIPNAWADVVISYSALEHTEMPLMELRKLLPKVKPGGMVVFSVPHESLSWRYEERDANQHLYTWSPMSAGNLFATAGFSVERVYTIRMIWPPMYRTIHRVCGLRMFEVICQVYRFGRLALSPIKRLGVDAYIVIICRRAME